MDWIALTLLTMVVASGAFALWMVWEVAGRATIQRGTTLAIHNQLFPASAWSWLYRPGLPYRQEAAVLPETAGLWRAYMRGWLCFAGLVFSGSVFGLSLLFLIAALDGSAVDTKTVLAPAAPISGPQ